MRNNKLIPGIVLVLIGTVFLLYNYGYISIHWSNIFHLWPIFIVIAGVNLIFANNRSPWAMAIKLTVIVVGFGLLFFGNFGNKFGFWPKGIYEFDIDDDDDYHGENGVVRRESNRFFEEPFNDSIRSARLNIHGGATSYRLSDTTSKLFSAETREFYGKYEFNPSKTDSSYVLDFRMKNNRFKNFGFKNDKSNKATFKLNPNPEWELDINAGATDLDFDLSKFKVRILHIDGGAASFKVKFGQPLSVTTVKVNTGASEVDIRIPRGAAASIDVHSGLSSDDFEGFNKVNDHRYETAGYATATNKFDIKINGGVSDFNVKRY